MLQLSCLEFQAALVCLRESTQVFSGIKEPRPLFVIQCDREASQSIDTYAAFLAHLKTHRAGLLFCCLFLKFGDPGQQLFLRWLCHWDHPPVAATAASRACRSEEHTSELQ